VKNTFLDDAAPSNFGLSGMSSLRRCASSPAIPNPSGQSGLEVYDKPKRKQAIVLEDFMPREGKLQSHPSLLERAPIMMPLWHPHHCPTNGLGAQVIWQGLTVVAPFNTVAVPRATPTAGQRRRQKQRLKKKLSRAVFDENFLATGELDMQFQ